MGDEHLDTIPTTESDEFIKSCVENLVPNPSESEGENGCDFPACFTTFLNILFDADYDFESVDDKSLHNEDLYDNSSPRPPEEFVYENSNAEIKSFSPSPIPNEDSDSFMEEIDLFITPDDPMPPSIEDDNDTEGDILFLERLLHDDPITLLDTLDFSYEVRIFLPFFTYPVTSPILLSSKSEDTIFDPCITINRFYFFWPGLSHWCGTFKKFNTHRSHLNESPMETLFYTCSPMDQ
nr:hypothetical protein [Tanacetum cinerariifolium]